MRDVRVSVYLDLAALGDQWVIGQQAAVSHPCDGHGDGLCVRKLGFHTGLKGAQSLRKRKRTPRTEVSLTHTGHCIGHWGRVCPRADTEMKRKKDRITSRPNKPSHAEGGARRQTCFCFVSSFSSSNADTNSSRSSLLKHQSYTRGQQSRRLRCTHRCHPSPTAGNCPLPSPFLSPPLFRLRLSISLSLSLFRSLARSFSLALSVCLSRARSPPLLHCLDLTWRWQHQ